MERTSIRSYDYGSIDEVGTSFEDIASIIAAKWADTQANPQNYTYLYHKFYAPFPIPSDDDYKLLFNTVNLYVKDVLKTVFEGSGFKYEGNVFESSFEKKYILFFGRVIREIQFEVSNSNEYHLELNTCVPQITVSTLIVNLAKTFCWCFYVDSNKRSVKVFNQKDIITAQGIDRSSRVDGTFQRSEKSLEIKRLNYSFTNEVDEYHQLAKDFDSYNFLGSVTRISDLPTVDIVQNSIMYVFYKMGYIRYLNVEEGWDISNPFQDLTGLNISNYGTSIDSNCGTVYVRTDVEGAVDGEQQPDVSLFYEGGIYLEDEPELSEDFAVSIYYGQYDFRGTELRPLVSHTPYSTDGQYFGEHSLRWRDDAGIYVRQWKPWLDFVNSCDEVEVDMLWTENDLSDPDLFLRPMFLYDEHSGTKQKYLLTEMKIVVGMQDGLRVSSQK